MSAGPSGKSQYPEIPDRLFFRIGEVSRIAGVETHVLRFWETEFSALAPKKTPSGQRQYRRKDVELVLAIRNLLHVQGYTIAGARRALRARGRASAVEGKTGTVATGQAQAVPVQPSQLAEIRDELQRILAMLAP